ncbi:unnamed protein product [Protopolystoma xenopodis]|uniref:Amino acid transporter transmembrane domain-containing protein n=1 Tax=Protopolystoma xenopodis TaxID=117903 RepID=A0A448WQR0_9PLAT|nr:unnamed protein product [Protopolystoma xenopodis]
MRRPESATPETGIKDPVLVDFEYGGTTSALATGWNISNFIQGVGILGIPYACANTGWLIAIVSILGVAALTCYTCLLISDCLYLPSQA